MKLTKREVEILENEISFLERDIRIKKKYDIKYDNLKTHLELLYRILNESDKEER